MLAFPLQQRLAEHTTLLPHRERERERERQRERNADTETLKIKEEVTDTSIWGVRGERAKFCYKISQYCPLVLLVVAG
jgi:hypothetical protein